MKAKSLIIDSREPDWVKALSFSGVKSTVSTLSCGDFWIATDDGQMLIIERKEANDLLASIADGRLFAQVHGMRAMTPWTYVIVQGALAPVADGVLADGRLTNWRWASVQGALQSVQELGAVVTYIPNGDHAAEELVSCIERLAARDRSALRIKPPRQAETLTPNITFLASLPGIGYDRAQTLVHQLESPAWALEYLTDLDFQSEHIPGIGAGIKRQVRELLGLTDGRKLAVTIED